MTFILHPSLEKKSVIIELPLCKVLFQDERHYPWLIAVPKIENARLLIDLSTENQIVLIKELDLIQKVLWNEFKPDQLNVAAIGNKTPQLHIHIIARYSNDPAWPGTVWDHPTRLVYDEDEKNLIINRIKNSFSKLL